MASESKKLKLITKYYESITNCFNHVSHYLHNFHCTTCNVNLSCAHGDIYDVDLNMKSEKHKAEKKLEK